MDQGRRADSFLQSPGSEALHQPVLLGVRQPGSALREGDGFLRHPGRFPGQRPDAAAASPRFLGLARELVLSRRRPADFFGIPERLIRQGGRNDKLSAATLTLQGVVNSEGRFPPDYIFLQHELKIFPPDYLLAGSAGEPFSG